MPSTTGLRVKKENKKERNMPSSYASVQGVMYQYPVRLAAQKIMIIGCQKKETTKKQGVEPHSLRLNQKNISSQNSLHYWLSIYYLVSAFSLQYISLYPTSVLLIENPCTCKTPAIAGNARPSTRQQSNILLCHYVFLKFYPIHQDLNSGL